MLCPRPTSIAAAPKRLLASWLAVVILVECIATAHAMGTGPLHRHRDGVALSATALEDDHGRSDHDEDPDHDEHSHDHGHSDDHGHWHEQAHSHGHGHSHDHGPQRHRHTVDDTSVVVLHSIDDDLDSGAPGTIAALDLMPVVPVRDVRDLRRHVLRAADPWPWTPVTTEPPRRPPRRV